MTYINDDIAWHTVANPTLERAVSLHLYSGPIDSCQYFDPDTRTIKTRQMTDFSVDGVIRPGVDSTHLFLPETPSASES